MIGLSSEIPLVSHTDVTSPFPPSGNEGYTCNRDVLYIFNSGAPLRILGPLDSIFTRALLPSGGEGGGGMAGDTEGHPPR